MVGQLVRQWWSKPLLRPRAACPGFLWAAGNQAQQNYLVGRRRWAVTIVHHWNSPVDSSLFYLATDRCRTDLVKQPKSWP